MPGDFRAFVLFLAVGGLIVPKYAAAQSEPRAERAAEGAPTPEHREPGWWESLTVGAFIDAYFSENWNKPHPSASANRFHPYDPNTGFGVAWFGLDATMQSDSAGLVAQARFGPSVPNLSLGDSAVPGGIGFLQNAYGQWKPGGKQGGVTLIAGKFDTPFGAEIAQSQLNFNYTRGFLYNLAQPFFHTGLRAEFSPIKSFVFKILAVNGWNNTIDNNSGKTFGAQVTLNPSHLVSFSLGWMGGPEQDDLRMLSCEAGTAFEASSGGCVSSPGTLASEHPVEDPSANARWREFFDLVVDLKPSEKFHAVVNADYAVDRRTTPGGPSFRKRVEWLGVSLLLRQQLTPLFAVAARGELIEDKDGFLTGSNANTTLRTGTFTIEATPSKELILRLEQRLDSASNELFLSGANGSSRHQWTSTLGLVARTP